MVWRRHDWSRPKVISRLTRSYRGAMASNMERTRAVFSSPWGSGSAVTLN